VIRALAVPVERLRDRAVALAERIRGLGRAVDVQVVDDEAYLGSGSCPAQAVPSVSVALRPRAMAVNAFSVAMRSTTTPVFGRVVRESVHLDMRTLQDGDEELIAAALEEVL
jgi:L-seryl-tRNA(Ser) seleniumtransferase